MNLLRFSLVICFAGLLMNESLQGAENSEWDEDVSIVLKKAEADGRPVLLLVRALRATTGAERQRAFGLLSFAGGCAVLALAIGWGRAATDMVSGMPMRYVLFAVPTLCATYFIWELYAPPTPRR